MSDSYFEPAHAVVFEENIKRSRFIANVIPCRSEDEIKSALKEICALHRTANHNCWAYALVSPRSEHSSDAGEPSGTAGRPILGEISRSALVNVLVVVTRYFGGIKLGTRGLIDAYGGTARHALEICPRVERIRTENLCVTLPFNSIGDVTHILTKTGAEGELAWEFSDEAGASAVRVSGAFRLSKISPLKQKLQELLDRNVIKNFNLRPCSVFQQPNQADENTERKN